MSKIILVDIETAPNLAYVWGKYEQDVIQFEKEWTMLSFSYKELGSKKTYSYALCDFKGYKKGDLDDSKLVKKLWEVLDSADIVIAHNGDNFDIKRSNSRFIVHGLTPPKPYRSLDTLKVARQKFGFNSNKLDDLGNILGIGRKVETGGAKLWFGCMAGDQKSWNLMKKYNSNDVVLLEKVYLKMRPWMTTHPNVALLDENLNCCPHCSSEKIQRRGFGYTKTSKYRRYQCMSCGAWSQGKTERIEGLEVR